MGPKINAATDRIKFAIAFANKDLNSLRPGDWLNLKEDFMHFLVGEKEGPLQHRRIIAIPGSMYVPAIKVIEPNFQVLQQLQLEVKNLLYTVGAGLTAAFHKTMAFEFGTVRSKPDLVDIGVASRQIEDLFLIVLFFLLSEFGAENVRACPECESIFWRDTRRQKFCTRRCSTLFTVKAYQRRQKEAAAKKSKKQHSKKITKKGR